MSCFRAEALSLRNGRRHCPTWPPRRPPSPCDRRRKRRGRTIGRRRSRRSRIGTIPLMAILGYKYLVQASQDFERLPCRSPLEARRSPPLPDVPGAPAAAARPPPGANAEVAATLTGAGLVRATFCFSAGGAAAAEMCLTTLTVTGEPYSAAHLVNTAAERQPAFLQAVPRRCAAGDARRQLKIDIV